MSSVFVNVGQCGVQLGQAFWSLLEERLDGSGERHPFYSIDGPQRRVLVDTEPKVLNSVRKKYQNKSSGAGNKACPIREENLLVSRRGRGANWAMGYSKFVEAGSGGSESLLDQTLESVRREVERCDAFSGFVVTHSLSGGTGSGMGSHLVEALRDEHPLAQQLSVCVLPSAHGENPMQSYNSALCLRHLQEQCDAVLLLENDVLLRQCQGGRGGGAAAAATPATGSVSVDDMNRLAAEMLGGLLLPTEQAVDRTCWSIGLEPWELCRSVCPMPTLKLFTVEHSRQSHARSWTAMAEQVARRQRLATRHVGPAAAAARTARVAAALSRSNAAQWRTISLTAVARGARREAIAAELPSLERCLAREYACVRWNPSPVDVWTARSAGPAAARGSTTLTVASNGAAVVHPLAALLERGERMHAARAFLHWYERYGCGGEQLGEAFECVHGILDAYATALE